MLSQRSPRLEMRALPNKPMVPTAATSPTTNPPCPVRRHIGQPLGSDGSVKERSMVHGATARYNLVRDDLIA